MGTVRSHIGRIMLVVLAAGLAGYGLAKLYLWYQAQHGIEELARLVAPYATLEWQGISAGLDAQTRISGLTLQPRGLNDTVLIKSLTIQTPAHLEAEELAHLLTLDESTDSLRVEARGITIRAEGPLLQRLNQLTGGYLWKTPLAALGCGGNIEKLDRAILTQANDDPVVHANAALRLRMQRPARRAMLVLDTDLQGLATTHLEATVDLDHPVVPSSAQTAEAIPIKVVALQIRYTDQGSNANRNLVCASKQNQPVGAFLDRHLTAVRAMYRARKPAPNEQFFTQYRDFATHGGDILIDLNFNKPMTLAALYRMGKQPLLTQAQFSLAINGVSIPGPAKAWYPWINQDQGHLLVAQKTAATDSVTEQPSRFHEIAVADLIDHIGEQARLITKDDSHHQGILEQIDTNTVTLRWEMSGGYMRFSIAADKIKEAQVYR
ncbi:LSm family protein [Nitrococcus mobilis]|uniref:Uncharacterized protein n=1 Tax=Nitrococcus mobilis Nb-231 TaxID=314278 RepID=A4BPE6_9GAMM|nr:hypothetical protein [Nitrococcus mobilis]EAR22447.1 hypothetical protein NB231_11944 [Nitrococcus mobilis Nb-231]